MKSATVAVTCAVVVFTTAVAEAWAAGRGGSRSASRAAARTAHPAHHRHHHGHTRVFVGSSLFYGPMYYPHPVPYYAPAAAYVEPEVPVVYIEQGQDPETQVWYYCQSARAFYPYAGECPEDWQRVVPDFPQTPPG